MAEKGNPEPVGVAVIGAGNWGKNHVRVYATMPEATLLYCCDRDENRLNAVGSQFPDVGLTTDYRKVLDDPGVRAVIVATPAPHHYSMVKEVLLAGKDVLVEKPLCIESAQGEELVQLADKEHRILMVGHLLIYHPAVQKMKEIIQAGELGKVLYAYSQRLNLGTIRQDESALWSFAPHDVSVFRELLGDTPIKVSAHGASYITPGREDVVFLTLEFSNQMIAHMHMSWLDPHKIRQMTFVGSDKMAIFDDTDSGEKIRIYDKGVNHSEFDNYADFVSLRQGDIYIPYVKMQEPLKLESEHFLECVRERRRPRSCGQDGLEVVRIIEAANSSMKSGGEPRLLAPVAVS
jgi:predicted dehydrogenase